jgi:hypothetical protein
MNGFITKKPIVQQRLYVINRSGSGEASYILLTPDRGEIATYQIKTDHWSATKGISNFFKWVIACYFPDRSRYHLLIDIGHLGKLAVRY